MTRDDVRAQFPEATEEQITAILNINGGDIQNAKKNSVDPKEMKRLQEIEEKYTKLTNDGLTDEEKIQQALDAAKEEKAKYLKSNNKLEVEKIFMQAGVSPDEYEKYIDSIVSEDAELSKTLHRESLIILSC
jgi:phage gp36-like protein